MNRLNHSFASLAFLIGSLAPMDLCRAVESPDPPANISEAVKKLAAVLGEHDPKNSQQFRITVNRSEIQQPEQDKPKVRDTTSGLTIYGTPYRLGDAACFDIVQHHNRIVYRLDSDDNETIVRRQQRFFLARVSVRSTESGSWEFQMTFLSHSVPSAIEQTYMKGTVNWKDDGFQLNGTATDEAYTASGDLIPSVRVAEVNFTREGPQLKVTDKWQGYHWSKALDGTKTAVPDFDRPIGQPAAWLQGISSAEGDD